MQSVGAHHYPRKVPSSLTCLIHLANNLCKDLELGYLAEERGAYSQWVFKSMRLRAEHMDELKETIGPSLVGEVKELVSRCTQS